MQHHVMIIRVWCNVWELMSRHSKQN